MKMTVQFILAAVPVIFLKAALIKRAWPATCTAHNNTLSQYLDATSYNHSKLMRITIIILPS
jgi:hypothetical protein